MHMSTKLTLYIEDDLIDHVKKYAKGHQLSVSRVVNNFLKLLKEESDIQDRVSAKVTRPLTQSLKGVLKEKDVTISDYHDYLEEKYL